MLLESLRSRHMAVWVAAVLGSALAASAQTSFVEFESGQVRPLALSPDGTKLFAVNTPDNRLEVFNVGVGALGHADSIPVGMEPVAVAARSNTEVWVVNHLSDSVSIVDLSSTPPRVSRTLLVGDEPRDIVFAGTGGNRAFISTAHRGQHRLEGGLAASVFTPGVADPQLTTEGIDRADVWVFDATSLGTTLGGTPVKVLSFFSDTPRALATDGTTVYVAAFHSGNQTTTVTELVVCNGFQTSGGTGCQFGAPGGVLAPATNCRQDDADPACEEAVQAPETGIIVKWDGSAWRDSGGRNWTSTVPFSLPDRDVFAFDANTLTAGSTFTGVGTILFNMVVNPTTQKLYVTNTELPNLTRFEGPGVHGGSTVQGHLSESRISVINLAGGSVDPQHLNHHIVYADLHTDAGANHEAIDAQIPHSLATPTQAVISSTGSVYVAAFGSSKIGVFSVSALENPLFDHETTPSYDPTVGSANYISTGGGPSGLVLDETHNRLYVLTRFDNSVRVINPSTKATLATHSLHNPEPASVVTGRQFLYDAQVSSGNGEASCSSCHIFGDLDSLAWNLGDPDGAITTNTQPEAVPILPEQPTFHPMKGPMTTQTLRGLATHGAMHWRGDRVDGFFDPPDPCTQPTGAPCSEDLSFRNFIVAFEGLLGKNGKITTTQMQQFTNFMLQVFLPPNPVRPLDNTLTGDAATGNTVFTGTVSDTVATCAGCHTLNEGQGFFGSGGRRSFEGEPQDAKVPHMRNLYAKIGMFGLPTGPNTGEQVRGFGFLHDGSVDTLFSFVGAGVFNLDDIQQAQLEQFSLAFPTDLAPIVGQQVTLTSTNAGVANARIDLMLTRANFPFTSLMLGGAVTECDVIVKGSFGVLERGWVRLSGGIGTAIFRDDTNQTIGEVALRALANSQGPLTYTCAPPGSGTRMGIDRDLDLDLDGLDNCPALANPGQEDANSNGIGDACESGAPDGDLDGVPDAMDNCPAVANPGQQDFDGDTAGDSCDTDDDDDGLLDTVETNTGIFVSPTNTGSNPLDTDSDDDGINDLAEVNNGTDPNDPDSPGPPVIPMLPLWGTLLLIGVVVFLGARMLKRSSGPPKTV